MMESELITMEEFAGWLGVELESLYARRVRHPELLPPTVTIGRRKYFRRSRVMEWLDALEVDQSAAAIQDWGLRNGM